MKESAMPLSINLVPETFLRLRNTLSFKIHFHSDNVVIHRPVLNDH
jgi:hypothetical protein